jgi:RNA polymerase sigma-70 factor (ECF subfamily)
MNQFVPAYDSSGIEAMENAREGYTAEADLAATEVSEEAALLLDFIHGDDSAFVELFDRHNQRLYLYCLKILADEQQAEDLLQELWERVIRLRVKPPEQTILTPGAFFVTMARNLCFNLLKQQKRRGVLNEEIRLDLTETTGRGARPEVERRELSELMDRALAELSMESREVLVLQCYSGFAYEEIAEMLSMTVTAVRMRASRARTQLRTAIEKIIDAPGGSATRAVIGELLGESI